MRKVKLIFPSYLRIHNINNITFNTTCLYICLEPKLFYITNVSPQVNKSIAAIFMMMIFTVVCQVVVSDSAYYQMVNIFIVVILSQFGCDRVLIITFYPAFSSKTCQFDNYCKRKMVLFTHKSTITVDHHH